MTKKEKAKSKKNTNKKPLGLKSHGKRKLSDAAVLEIVSRYAAGGVTQRALAVEFGVSAPNISAICTGKTYVWLTRIGLPPIEEKKLAA